MDGFQVDWEEYYYHYLVDLLGLDQVKMRTMMRQTWDCESENVKLPTKKFFFQGTINNLEKNPATVGRGVKVRPVPIDIMTIMINQPIHPSKNTHTKTQKKPISVPINIMITNVLLRNQYQDCELPGE